MFNKKSEFTKYFSSYLQFVDNYFAFYIILFFPMLPYLSSRIHLQTQFHSRESIMLYTIFFSQTLLYIHSCVIVPT